MAVVPARGLWVDANFKETQLSQMRPGLPVSVAADVLPGRTFRGHIESLAPATGAQFSVIPPENATGNFTRIVQRVPVRIALDGDAAMLGSLRPGLSVTAVVDARSMRADQQVDLVESRHADRQVVGVEPIRANQKVGRVEPIRAHHQLVGRADPSQ
jgi:membrane fusion protein (multidrug efflux system)